MYSIIDSWLHRIIIKIFTTCYYQCIFLYFITRCKSRVNTKHVCVYAYLYHCDKVFHYQFVSFIRCVVVAVAVCLTRTVYVLSSVCVYEWAMSTTLIYVCSYVCKCAYLSACILERKANFIDKNRNTKYLLRLQNYYAKFTK